MILFKNPKSEDKCPKVSIPKDVILDHSLNNYLQMMQDGLKVKVHSYKKTYLTPDDRCSFHRKKMDHHLNSIRMWSSLESRCFSFWEKGIDTSISFDPAGWCTSTDLVVTALLHYILKTDSILYLSFQTRHLFYALLSDCSQSIFPIK